MTFRNLFGLLLLSFLWLSPELEGKCDDHIRLMNGTYKPVISNLRSLRSIGIREIRKFFDIAPHERVQEVSIWFQEAVFLGHSDQSYVVLDNAARISPRIRHLLSAIDPSRDDNEPVKEVSAIYVLARLPKSLYPTSEQFAAYRVGLNGSTSFELVEFSEKGIIQRSISGLDGT